jgi:hypothetical protein
VTRYSFFHRIQEVVDAAQENMLRFAQRANLPTAAMQNLNEAAVNRFMQARRERVGELLNNHSWCVFEP